MPRDFVDLPLAPYWPVSQEEKADWVFAGPELSEGALEDMADGSRLTFVETAALPFAWVQVRTS